VTAQARVLEFNTVPASLAIVDEIPDVPDTRISLEEHEAACEAAYKRGAEETNTLLTEQILAQRAEVAQLQDALFKSLALQSESLVHQVSEPLPDLVMEIARRVLAGHTPDTATIRSIVTETLAEIAPDSTGVEVWLSPSDLALVEGIMKDFDHKYPGITISADPELVPGDCRAKSRFGAIDARLSTKLDAIARSLQ
jgi:flagellar biosynthesis/type III secretory pathway protein FliH